MANIKSINGNPIVVGTSGIEDGSVTDAKLVQSGGVLEEVSYLEDVLAPNVFNNSILTVSGKTIWTNGKPTSQPDFAHSDFIPSLAGMKYTVIAPTIENAGYAVAFYSDNTFGSFISGVSLTTGNVNVDAVAPEGTRYVIFSYRVASGEFKCVVTTCDSIVNVSNYLSAENGIIYYDNSTLTIAGKVVLRNGTISSHNDFSASDFIKSAQGAAYTIHAPTVANTGSAIAFYADDSVDSFISGVTLSNGNDDVTAIAPAGTKYVRFSYRTASGNFNCSVNTLESLFNNSALAIDHTNQIKEHKSFSIIGDSYTAYPNWVPSGQASYYPGSSSTVSSVSQMWWYLLAKQLKWSPLIVDGYSGTTVCTHVRGSHSQDVAYVNRVVNTMGANRSLESKPDYIFILGGQNDYNVGAEVGDVMYSGWTDADLYKFAPAFCYLIDYLMTWNPGSVIINITNTGGVSSDMADKMAAACAHYGITNVILANISKELDHPTATGMESICSQVIASIK